MHDYDDNIIELPILKKYSDGVIELPKRKDFKDDIIELPILSDTSKKRDSLTKTIKLPIITTKEKTSVIPVIKNTEMLDLKIDKLDSLYSTIIVPTLDSNEYNQVPITRNINNATIEIPAYERKADGTISQTDYNYVIPDNNLYPVLKKKIVDTYSQKINHLENTTIYNVVNSSKLVFPEVLDNYLSSITVDDLAANITYDDLNRFDDTVLLKLPFSNKKKKYIQIEKFAYYNIILCCIVGILFLGGCVFSSVKSYQATNKQTEHLRTFINDNSSVIVDGKVPIIIDDGVSETNNEVSYINVKKYYIDTVNFNELSNINSDIIGWIAVNGTEINYPLVKTVDNDYYLSHSFDKSSNVSGWVFMDYRNDVNDFSQNTLLYGHNAINGTMFGTLNYLFGLGESQLVTLITKERKYVYQVFSIYVIPTTTDYLATSFSNDDEYSEFLSTIKSRSRIDFGVDVGTNDKIITFSTCYGATSTSRTVMHAKLIN